MSKFYKILIISIFLFKVDISLSEEIINKETQKKIEEELVEETKNLQEILENKETLIIEEKIEEGPKKYSIEDYEVVEGTRQVGQATYYAKKFHGNRTTSGERFSLYEYTAAHRTLPFGTLVKVTNRANGKSVIVRINDRGPFSKGRILDLSPVAFEEIGSLKTGVLNVTLEVVEEIIEKIEEENVLEENKE